MAIIAVFLPLVLLVVLVALGRYEELMLPPATDESEAPDGTALAGRAAGNAPQRAPRSAREADARHV